MASAPAIAALSLGKPWRVIPAFLTQSPAGEQGGLWSRRFWLGWMQVFAARVDPSQPKTSFPAGAVELRGGCCRALPATAAGITPFPFLPSPRHPEGSAQPNLRGPDPAGG